MSPSMTSRGGCPVTRSRITPPGWSRDGIGERPAIPCSMRSWSAGGSRPSRATDGSCGADGLLEGLLGEQRSDRETVERAGEEEALPLLASQQLEFLRLLLELDALRDRPEVERFPDLEDRPRQGRFLRVPVHAVDERLIDLEHVDREPSQVTER